MSAYFIFNYSVTDPGGYAPYAAAAGQTLAGRNVEVLVADRASDAVEGAPHQVTVILRFDSKEDARAWYESPEYEAVKPMRTENAESVALLCDGLGAAT